MQIVGVLYGLSHSISLSLSLPPSLPSLSLPLLASVNRTNYTGARPSPGVESSAPRLRRRAYRPRWRARGVERQSEIRTCGIICYVQSDGGGVFEPHRTAAYLSPFKSGLRIRKARGVKEREEIVRACKRSVVSLSAAIWRRAAGRIR